MYKVALTGAGGNIGFRLARLLEKKYDVTCFAHNHIPAGLDAVSLDITDADAVHHAITRLRPYAVINTAALADANLCQRQPELADSVNVAGVINIAKACAAARCRLIHYSTDLVFDGRTGMYNEKSAPNPIGVYGATKSRSELVALGHNEATAILRTAIVYGAGSGKRPTFFEHVVRRARKGEASKVFINEYRSFLYMDDSATAAISLLKNFSPGIYHAGGNERLSRHVFVSRMFSFLGLDAKLAEPVKIADVDNQVYRPADCSLYSGKLKDATGWKPASISEGMRKFKIDMDL